MYVNVTRKCNLGCDYCYSASGRSGEDVDFNHVLSLMDEIKPRRIGISGGEPLLVADKLADFMGRYPCKTQTTLYTNGLLIEEKLKTVGDRVDILKINFPATTRKVYQQLNGVDTFDTVIRGVKTSVRSGIETILNTTLNHQNIKEVKAIVDFAADNEVGEVNVLRVRPSGRAHNIELTPRDVMTAYQELLSSGKERGVKIDLHDPLANLFGIEVKCAAATGYLNVDTDSGLGPCPFFNQTVKGEFKDIWENNELFKAARQPAKECEECSTNNCLGGCRACSTNISGSVKKDPWCFKDILESV
ncbi:hypothetical protein A3K64_04120 [Candidatus Micrarchaeota archaeon RBG_16_36_9]|nr:MAG: hypothetical protein A3K64_04120 [Candidatus Micrarchaeota archaeon RBG_16_36_9]